MKKICKRGHEWDNEETSRCFSCIKDYQKSDAYKEYLKKYQKSDAYKDYKKEYQIEYRKSDAGKEVLKKYQKSDAQKEARKKYQNSDAGKRVRKDYRIEYRETDAHKEAQKRYRETDTYKAVQIKSAAKRAAAIKRATPKWLTDSEHRIMSEFYINKPSTHAVDHQIPIQGRNVSGLNVPWNMQYLLLEENRVKSNSFDGTLENTGWRKDYEILKKNKRRV